MAKELILDLYQCNKKALTSKAKIKKFVKEVSDLLKVKRYKSCFIERFGKNSFYGEGYSFFQFIETSSISGHLDEIRLSAHLNIFSCKDFDERKIAQFSQKFFEAKKMKMKVLKRI